jgi:hypothetical protein
MRLAERGVCHTRARRGSDRPGRRHDGSVSRVAWYAIRVQYYEPDPLRRQGSARRPMRIGGVAGTAYARVV